MDEAADPVLHRWLSLCRLLMLFHPRVGARFYQSHVFGGSDIKPGWNAVHSPEGAAVPVRYIFIGPDEGLNTDRKPDIPDAELHHSHETDIPEFEGSIASQLLQALTQILADRNIPGYDAPALSAQVAAINAAARTPLRGETQAVDDRIRRDLGRMKKAIASGAPVAELTKPLADILQDGLALKLSGTHASNILSVLLGHLLSLPSPLDQTPLTARISVCIDHLTEHTLALERERQKLKLTPFYTATYLALLLGNTALLLCKQAAAQFPVGSDDRRRYEQRGLYIDEACAHNLWPCLMHPIDYVPFSRQEYHHAKQIGIIDAGGMYEGLQGQSVGTVDAENIWPAIQSYAARAADDDIAGSVNGDNSPLPPEALERLQMFRITMLLGNAAAR